MEPYGQRLPLEVNQCMSRTRAATPSKFNVQLLNMKMRSSHTGAFSLPFTRPDYIAQDLSPTFTFRDTENRPLVHSQGRNRNQPKPRHDPLAQW